MSSALPVKGRHAGADVTQSMSDATAQAVKRSKEHFIADMRKLLSEARRYLGDVCWRLDGEDEIIYGHRGELQQACCQTSQLGFGRNQSDAYLEMCLTSRQRYSTHEQMQPSSLAFSIQMAALASRPSCRVRVCRCSRPLRPFREPA